MALISLRQLLDHAAEHEDQEPRGGVAVRPAAKAGVASASAAREGGSRAPLLLLVQAAGRWAKERGCWDLASDALLENVDSHRFHESAGFAEVERAVHYVQALREE